MTTVLVILACLGAWNDCAYFVISAPCAMSEYMAMSQLSRPNGHRLSPCTGSSAYCAQMSAAFPPSWAVITLELRERPDGQPRTAADLVGFDEANGRFTTTTGFQAKPRQQLLCYDGQYGN